MQGLFLFSGISAPSQAYNKSALLGSNGYHRRHTEKSFFTGETMKRILFTGGGSAGHVIPNIALIDELLSTGEADIFYMGTDGIEKRLIAPWHIPFYTITCPKLIRGGGFKGFQNNIKIPKHAWILNRA